MKLLRATSFWRFVAVAAVCSAVVACPPSEKKETKTLPKVEQDDPAIADIKEREVDNVDVAKVPAAGEAIASDKPLEITARFIVVGLSKRDKDTARKRATHLASLARQRGADFDKLAQQYSDAPQEERGKPEVFEPHGTNADFAKAVFHLEIGQVSDPVATDRGYFVVQRIASEEYSSAHVVIMYKGAKLAPVTMTRTKEQALALAEKVRAAAVKGAEDFSVIASRNSDLPSGRARGGVIAPIAPYKMPAGMSPYLTALKQLKVGEVSNVVETDYGFHVIKRLPLQKIAVRHILIAFDSSRRPPRTPRKKSEAITLATSVRQQAIDAPQNFGQLAKQYSDDASADVGGDLAPFARGQMNPRFEQFAFALSVGQISSLVETEFGFHIIQRIR